MAKVAFWGPRHGQVATTSSVVAVSASIGMSNPVKTMVSHTHWNRSTLESAFRKHGKTHEISLAYTDFGIDALERLAKSNRLTPDAIRNNASPIIEGRLDLLYGTSKPDETFHSSIVQALPSILETADDYYDLTIIDVNSGMKNVLTNTILKSSDLIVVCLNQNISLLDSFFSKEEYPEILDQKDHLILLGNYDPRSKYSAKNIRRKYGIKDLFTIPHCTQFMDAANDNNVLDFYLRNRNIPTGHENAFFFDEVKRISRAITGRVGLGNGRSEAGGE